MAFITNLLRSIRPGHASLGLEITDSFIKLAEIHTAPGKKPLMVKCAMERLPAGTVVDGRIKNPLVLHRLLEQTVKLNDFGTRNVHMVIPSPSIMVRYMKFPNLPDRQLRKIIEFEIQHTIHLPFERPYFDFINMSAGEQVSAKINKKTELSTAREPYADNNSSWNEMAATLEQASHTLLSQPSTAERSEDQEEDLQADVILIAAPQELVDELLTLVRQCGLKPVSAEIKALSFYRLIEQAEPQLTGQTILTVDLNESAADISIFHEGHLKITRNVPVNFGKPHTVDETEEQAALRLLLDPQAEFQTACEDLAHELERLINFYRYTLNNRSHDFRITVLTGEAERLKEASDYLGDRLGHTVLVPRLDWIDSRIPDYPSWVSRLAIPVGLGLRGNKA